MKVLVSLSLCSETLTSNEGFVYVTVTSLILCFATLGHFSAIKEQDETALIHILKVTESCCQLP